MSAKVEQVWDLEAPLRLRKVKELAAARSCLDPTSLLKVAADQGEASVLSSHAWRLWAKYRLGAPLTEVEDAQCPGCSHITDRHGDHALCCRKLGLYARHNDLCLQFSELCKEAGLQVEIEQGPADSLDRPADALVHGLDGPSPVSADFSVVHALQLSADLADVHPGKLAAAVERRKRRENRRLCAGAGWQCQPFAVEARGAWRGGARFLLLRLGKAWALKHGCSSREAYRTCQDRLGVAVLRAVCRQLERGFPEPGVETEPPPVGLLRL